MAKHPVPKKKVSQARTARRHAAFTRKKHVTLNGLVKVIACPGCGQPKMNQFACPSCGTFRGRTLKKSSTGTKGIKKIKA